MNARQSAVCLLVLTSLGLMQCSAPQVTKTLTPMEHALQLRDDGRLAEAEQEFKTLADRGEPRATLELAETQILRGHHADALALLKPRATADVNDAEAVGLLARALDGLGRIDESIAMFARDRGRGSRPSPTRRSPSCRRTPAQRPQRCGGREFPAR